ncbi:MAG: AraC family transcriptional regulator [Oscillospiraceae bacterium]|jgi:AraC-like DNA-binding protein|nr:AraC family transcriptional regulator [Oscillospiraceae bacterium]
MTDFEKLFPDVIHCAGGKYAPDRVVAQGRADCHSLTYALGGKGVYSADGERLDVGAGDMLYAAPGSFRKAHIYPEEHMELYAVNFKLRAGQTLPFPAISHPGCRPALMELFVRLTRVWAEKEPYFAVEARGLTLQIICALARVPESGGADRRADPKVERVKAYVRENYTQPLSVPALAQLVGLNPVYFGSLFMRSEQCSVKEYINRMRINRALEILRTENLPVVDVALACGFGDAFYFSRVFKELVGVPPSKLRRGGSAQ